MFENLLLVGVVIALFWIGLFVFYLYTSRQQQKIAGEIEKLNQQLGDDPKDKE